MSQAIHVVLVEDDTFLASIYKTKFEQDGFKVTVSDNGDDGLEVIRKKQPDLVLLDILLPKRDGFSVLAELKLDKHTVNIPVILLTNLGQKEDVEKGLKEGAAGYIIKAHSRPSETVAEVKKILKIK